MSLSTAKTYVSSARSKLETGRFGEVDEALERAVGFLAGLPAEEIAEIMLEIAVLHTAAVEAEQADEAEGKVRQASLRVRRAANDLDSGYSDENVAETLAGAEQMLDGVADKYKAEVLADIAALRGRLSGIAPAPLLDSAESAEAPSPTADAGPSDDDCALLSQVRGEIRSARSLVETRRTDRVAEELDELTQRLANIAEAERTPLLAEIDEIRAALNAAIAAEDTRRIESELDRHLSTGEYVDASAPAHSGAALDRAAKRLDDEDVQRILSDEAIMRYRNRLASAITTRAAAIKEFVLGRAHPLLDELEAQVASDPFAGVDDRGAYDVMIGLQSLKYRIQAELRDHVPEDDADAAAIEARIVAAEATVERASAEWGRALRRAKLEARFADAARRVEGWQHEAFEPQGPLPFQTPDFDVPLTHQAATNPHSLLEDPEMREIFEELSDEPSITEMLRSAEVEYEAALAKMATAYHRVLDDAEKLPTPTRPHEREAQARFVGDAQRFFGGTSQFDSVVTRARDLDERLKVEFEQIMTARQELWDRLVVEADAQWPSIVDATGASPDIDPTAADAQGKTVLLKDVYNRAGWEHGGFNFTMQYGDTPIGGDYAPHVTEALEHAWYQLKFTAADGNDGPAVNDRLPWDVIAVVEGPGKLTERTTITIKEVGGGREIGKEERWLPVDGVVLRIIGLRAGALAVGPDQGWSPAP